MMNQKKLKKTRSEGHEVLQQLHSGRDRQGLGNLAVSWCIKG